MGGQNPLRATLKPWLQPLFIGVHRESSYHGFLGGAKWISQPSTVPPGRKWSTTHLGPPTRICLEGAELRFPLGKKEDGWLGKGLEVSGTSKSRAACKANENSVPFDVFPSPSVATLWVFADIWTPTTSESRPPSQLPNGLFPKPLEKEHRVHVLLVFVSPILSHHT